MLVKWQGPMSMRALGPGCSARHTFAAVIVVVALTGAAAAATANVKVSNGRFRFVIPSRPAAGYFTIENDSARKLRLVGAASPACGMLMLHQSREANGVESMRPVAGVDVPPHGKLSFAPGGYHLMCMSPSAAMKPGAVAPVTLSFADGSKTTAEFKIGGAKTP